MLVLWYPPRRNPGRQTLGIVLGKVLLPNDSPPLTLWFKTKERKIYVTHRNRAEAIALLWNFPSLDKEGWRVAPGWFESGDSTNQIGALYPFSLVRWIDADEW